MRHSGPDATVMGSPAENTGVGLSVLFTADGDGAGGSSVVGLTASIPALVFVVTDGTLGTAGAGNTGLLPTKEVVFMALSANPCR